MKHLFIITIVLLTLFSCVNKKEKTTIQTISTKYQKSNRKKKKENIFYKNNTNLKTFDFNQLPLSKDIDDISNNNTDRYSVSERLRREILKKENYYKLVNYSKIKDTKNYKAITVFGNYDYYTNIFLITSKFDSLIDYKVIASIIGDADNMTEINTSFLDSTSFKVITRKKCLTKNEGFKTVSVDSRVFKITHSGQID